MKPAIALKNILVQQGDNFRLSVENLELFPHRIYALTGPNGAGKSTLLRVMALLITPRRGEICLAHGCRSDSLTRQRQHVSLVEQNPYLFDGSVFDNLAFGLKLRGIRGKPRKPGSLRLSTGLASVVLSSAKPGNSQVERFSGWPCHARWYYNREYCCWMNQLRTSTARASNPLKH